MSISFSNPLKVHAGLTPSSIEKERIEIAVLIEDQKKHFNDIVTLQSLYKIRYYPVHQSLMKVMEGIHL